MLEKPWNTGLSLLLLSLGVGIISLIMLVSQQIQMQLKSSTAGIDMVVGAKGSPLQLILSSVLHIDDPTGNISLQEAEKLIKNPLVASGIPLAYGDNFEGFRIVGTQHAYAQLYKAEVQQGHLFENAFEVTIGAQVAQKLNLGIGDVFTSAHGLDASGAGDHHQHPYKVVGIFEPTQKIIDQLILTSLQSVWDSHHEEESASIALSESKHEHDHDENHQEHNNEHQDKEITAMLIKFRSPMGMVQLPRQINEQTKMQAALPQFEISRLITLMGVGTDALTLLAIAIIIVAGLSVFISLYNALSERLYEMAFLRIHGATRWQLAGLVIQEAIVLVVCGFIMGILGSRIGLYIIASLFEDNYQYHLVQFTILPDEFLLGIACIVLGFVASLLPAIRAFTINISKTLSNA